MEIRRSAIGVFFFRIHPNKAFNKSIFPLVFLIGFSIRVSVIF